MTVNGRVPSLFLLASLLGCKGGPDSDSGCSDGEVERYGTCVPDPGDACGAEWWGAAADGASHFVDPYAPGGGDGSQEAPFNTIDAALSAAGPNGSIALAAGTYTEFLTLDERANGVALAGRCAADVILDGDGNTEGSSMVSMDLASASASIRDLAIQDPTGCAVAVSAGSLALENLTISGSGGCGVDVSGGAVAMTALNLSLEDAGAIGVSTSGDSVVQGSNLHLYDMQGAALVAAGTSSVTRSDVDVRDMRYDVAGDLATVAEVGAQATVQMDEITAEDIQGPGVWCHSEGAQVALSNVSIARLSTTEIGDQPGIFAERGCVVTATDVSATEVSRLVAGASGAGVLEMSSFQTSDLVGGDDGTGMAIGVWSSGRVVCSDCVLSGSVGIAAYAGEGTTLSLTDTTIDDLDASDFVWGDGTPYRMGSAVKADGATLNLERVDITDGTMIAVYSTGGVVTLRDVDIADTAAENTGVDGGAVWGVGAYLASSDEVLVDNLTVAGSTYFGLALIQSSGTVTNAMITDTLAAEDHGVGEVGAGIAVMEGSVVVSSSTVLNSGTTGLYVWGAGDVEFDGVVVDGVATTLPAEFVVGLDVEDEATVRFANGEIRNVGGPGIWVEGNSNLELESTVIQSCAFADIASGGGTLALSDCTLDSTTADPIWGGGVGIYSGGGQLVLADSDIAEQSLAALWVTGGETTVTGCSLEGGEGLPDGAEFYGGHAIYATASTTAADLVVADSTLSGARVAVLLHGASATFSNDSWEANSLDLQQQSCDGVEGPVGLDDIPTTLICPADEAPEVSVNYTGGYE